MSSDASDRRKYFRIDNSVLLSYTIVSEQEMQEGIRELSSGGFPKGGISTALMEIEVQLQGAMSKLQQKNKELQTVLELMNVKVNALLDMLPIVGNRQDSLLDSEPTQVNISASGISFPSNEAIAPGSKIQLRLVLAPNYQYVTAFASVVRCAKSEGKSEYEYEVAAEFTFMLDRFKEIIIKYAMHKQSAQLKLRRMSTLS